MIEPDKIHYVSSRKHDKVYQVNIWANGYATCECLGYKYHTKCRHIDLIINKYYRNVL